MSFKLKSGNTSAFKMMGSSPAKGVKVKPREGGKAPYSKDKSGPKAEANYSDEATAEDLSRQSLKQKYMRKQLTVKKKVDPDAPGTPGKPGYEPPVKRSDLDAKGKKLYDSKRKAKPSPAKNFLEKIDKASDEVRASSPAKAACAPGGKSNTGGECGNFKVNKKGTVVSRLANKVGKGVKNTAKKITKSVTKKVKKIKKNKMLNKDSSGSYKTVRYL